MPPPSKRCHIVEYGPFLLLRLEEGYECILPLSASSRSLTVFPHIGSFAVGFVRGMVLLFRPPSGARGRPGSIRALGLFGRNLDLDEQSRNGKEAAQREILDKPRAQPGLLMPDHE